MRRSSAAGILVASLIGSLAPQARAADSYPLALPSRPHYVFQRVGENLGLGSLTPSCLLQDGQGFIWIGTPNGLLRYDGSHILRFGIEQGLPGTGVDQLALSPDGRLWMVTSRGIAYMEGGVIHPLALPAPYDSSRPTPVLALDSAGLAYLTSEHGLLRVDPGRPGQPRVWSVSDGLPAPEVETVSVASDGRVWFASAHRVGWLDSNDRVHMFPIGSGLAHEPVLSILQDFEKTLWVRTSLHLYRLNPVSNYFVPDPPSIPPSNDLGAPSLDLAGNLVVPTVEGLYRRMNGEWEVIDRSRGMAVNATFSVTEDREGAYWIGLGGAGIDRWSGRKTWSAWTEGEGLPDNVVWSELRDFRKRLWVGTNSGVTMWDPPSNRWRKWKSKDGLNGNIARELRLAPDGSVWVLCFPGGITRFDPQSLRPEKVPTPDPNPTGLHAGPDGRMWIANSHYLKSTLPKRPFVFSDVIGPPEARAGIGRFVSSPDGVLWLCGRKGLFRFDGSQWLQFTAADGLLQTEVNEAAAVSRDEVWFHYGDALGLSRLRLVDGKPQLTHFGLAQGLPSLDVYMLGADHEGNVWAGGAFGLTEFVRNGRVLRFTHSDGLIWNDLSDGGFFAEEDGTLLFGTSGGLARYNPVSVDDRLESAPTVVITSAVLGSRDRLAEGNPSAPRNDNSFRVQFAALTYRDPENVPCFYQLVGLESEPNETLSRETRYPALQPGNYRFQVICRSAMGTLSLPAKFDFTIARAWWQRWYARAFGVLLGIFALYGLISYRTRKLQDDRLRLEKAVAERSDALARANRELEEMIVTDPLTGTRNRRFFQMIIKSDVSQAIRAYAAEDPAQERNRDIIFYLIDADHFKEINDRFGHDAGDRLLIDMTKRINSAIRDSDVLVRWGGEEFLVVSRLTERTEAGTLAARILSTVATEPFEIKGASVILHRTCSIGWAAFPWNVDAPDHVAYEEVLSHADRALYKAKAAGRNQAVGAIPSRRHSIKRRFSGKKDSASASSKKDALVTYVTTYGLEITSKV
jgi:diguanylate cyclase (GGDEF)-like protein